MANKSKPVGAMLTTTILLGLTIMFSRMRSHGSLTPISCTLTTMLCNGTSTTSSPISGSLVGSAVNMWDTPTPDFHRRSAAGEVIITNMRREHREFTFTGGGIKMGPINPPPPPSTAIKSTDYSSFLSLVGISDVVAPNDSQGYGLRNTFLDIESAVTEAATKCAANVSPAPIQGLAIVGEGAQTLSMLMNPLAAIRKYLKNYRKFKGRQFAEMTAEQFLEVWWGMKPFFRDIDDIVALFEQQSEAPPERETARAKVTRRNVQQLGTVRHQGTSWYIDVRREFEEVFEYRRGILTQDAGSFFNRKIGYRLSDIPSAVWELTPWSCVIDWFVNLNQYISAVTPVVGVTPLGAWESWSFHQVLKHMVSGSGVPSAYSTTYQNMRPCTDVYNQSMIVTGRNAKTAGADIGLVWKPKMTFTRVMLAAALTIQQLKGVPPRR